MNRRKLLEPESDLVRGGWPSALADLGTAAGSRGLGLLRLRLLRLHRLRYLGLLRLFVRAIAALGTII